MILRAIAFTEKGLSWQQALGVPVTKGVPVRAWTERFFDSSDALLYIGAVGIAVRAIAPHIKNKTTDPAVLVMDEAGRHVIPILSGHIGGANEIARQIAQRTGATPVITTATDLRNLPAIDTWAVENDCAIENPDAIKSFSGAALAGERVGVMISERQLKSPFPVTLTLRPRTLVLGAGCKKGVDRYAFERSATEFLDKNGLSLLSLKALATIDIKKNEDALKYFSDKYSLEFHTYSAGELNETEGSFAHSDFVEKTVGTGNVCERAAVRASGGRLLVGKTVFEGVTLALAGDRNT